MWCLFFGVGVLVWGQVITSIPTRRLPKMFTWGSGPPDETAVDLSLLDDGSNGSVSQDGKRTGQILWIRGLTRLQTQVTFFSLLFYFVYIFFFNYLKLIFFFICYITVHCVAHSCSFQLSVNIFWNFNLKI